MLVEVATTANDGVSLAVAMLTALIDIWRLLLLCNSTAATLAMITVAGGGACAVWSLDDGYLRQVKAEAEGEAARVTSSSRLERALAPCRRK